MPPPYYKRILLFTGGLDSVCAWFLLGKPAVLYVPLSSNRDARDELEALRVAGTIGVPELNICPAQWPQGPMADGHIPLRNLHLVTVGALYSDLVMLGAVRGESSPDKSDRFLKHASHAISSASQGRSVRVVAPFKGQTKRVLVRSLIRKVGRPKALRIIRETRSCYARDTDRCGKCMACFRRWVALSLNGIHEQHDRNPWQVALPSREQRLAYLRGAPLREWPGIAESNAEAALALAKASLKGPGPDAGFPALAPSLRADPERRPRQ